MAVPAVGRVGDDDLRRDLLEHGDERVDLVGEASGAASARGCSRAGVAARTPCPASTMPESRQRPVPPRNRWSVTPSAAHAAASSLIR